MINYVFFVVAFALIGTYTIYSYKHENKVEVFLKTLLTTSILALAIVNSSNSNFIIIGLAFAVLGDFCLGYRRILKQQHRREHGLFLKLGFIFFCLTHLSYLIYVFRYLISFDLINFKLLLIPFIMFLSIVFYKYLIRNYPIRSGSFQKISNVYEFIETLLLSTSIYLSIFYNFNHLFTIGLLLFVISDMILNLIYFSKVKNKQKMRAINHLFYFLGQLIIAVSLFI